MRGDGRRGRHRAALACNIAAALAGLLLISLAAAAGRGWADRHFLPTFTWPRSTQMHMLLALRLAAALIGLAVLLLVRPRIARAVREGRGLRLLGSSLSILLALAASVGVAEGVLRSRQWRSVQERWDSKEPRRRPDLRYGWSNLPSHSGTNTHAGRIVHYSTDRFGYRARSPADRLDFGRPTILFGGESIAFGYGLEWDESAPAQLQAMTGIQTANVAVNAFGTDQAYLRLKSELPRFSKPVAVVILFTPFLLDRNLDRDRMHLDSGLRWHRAETPPLRLAELARRLLRYRSEERIAEGVTMTRNVLRATIALARSRGSKAIILVPEYMPEDPLERSVRHRVLDEAGLPYLLVPLDSSWQIKGDRHPNARGARAIAAAVAGELGAGQRRGHPDVRGN